MSIWHGTHGLGVNVNVNRMIVAAIVNVMHCCKRCYALLSVYVHASLGLRRRGLDIEYNVAGAAERREMLKLTTAS